MRRWQCRRRTSHLTQCSCRIEASNRQTVCRCAGSGLPTSGNGPSAADWSVAAFSFAGKALGLVLLQGVAPTMFQM